jgi:hypothetical protein
MSVVIWWSITWPKGTLSYDNEFPQSKKVATFRSSFLYCTFKSLIWMKRENVPIDWGGLNERNVIFCFTRYLQKFEVAQRIMLFSMKHYFRMSQHFVLIQMFFLKKNNNLDLKLESLDTISNGNLFKSATLSFFTR